MPPQIGQATPWYFKPKCEFQFVSLLLRLSAEGGGSNGNPLPFSKACLCLRHTPRLDRTFYFSPRRTLNKGAGGSILSSHGRENAVRLLLPRVPWAFDERIPLVALEPRILHMVLKIFITKNK